MAISYGHDVLLWKQLKSKNLVHKEWRGGVINENILFEGVWPVRTNWEQEGGGGPKSAIFANAIYEGPLREVLTSKTMFYKIPAAKATIFQGNPDCYNQELGPKERNYPNYIQTNQLMISPVAGYASASSFQPDP